jgi:hypothetical protein
MMGIQVGSAPATQPSGVAPKGNGGPPPIDLHSRANFEELVDAYYSAHKSRDQAEYHRIDQAFEHAYGTVEHGWFGKNHHYAVVLTDQGYLYLTTPFQSAQAADLCFSAMAIQSEARRKGVAADCGYLLYLACVSLLQALDAGDPLGDEMIKAVNRQLEKASETYVARQKRHARLWYAGGVIAGAFGVFAISVATYVVLPKLISNLVDAAQLQHVVEMFTACLNAGGAGALLSVMTRMSSGTVHIRYDENKWTLFLVGGFRPVIGAVSGVALYVLFKAQLLPLQVPVGASEFFTFGGLAFVAGFSERLAQDALMQTDQVAFGRAKPA